MATPDLPGQDEAAPAEPLVIFHEYERLDTCKALQVTRENLLDVAQHFGWAVEFVKDGKGDLQPGLNTGKRYAPSFTIGDWITEGGQRFAGLAPYGQWRPRGHWRVKN